MPVGLKGTMVKASQSSHLSGLYCSRSLPSLSRRLRMRQLEHLFGLFRSPFKAKYFCSATEKTKGWPHFWQTRDLSLSSIPGFHRLIIDCFWVSLATCLSRASKSQTAKMAKVSSVRHFLKMDLQDALYPVYLRVLLDRFETDWVHLFHFSKALAAPRMG